MRRDSITENASISRCRTIARCQSPQKAQCGFAIGALLSVSVGVFLGCSGEDEIVLDQDAAIKEDGPVVRLKKDSSAADVDEIPDVSNDRIDGEVFDDSSTMDAPSEQTDAPSEQDSGCVHIGPPVIDLDQLEACSLCERAHCFATDLIDSAYRDELADCEDEGTKCVPDLYLETGGQFSLKSCTSLQGTEGRCMSLCIPKVKEMKDTLPIDECRSDERCTPCFDLISGEDTGACGLSCDPGSTDEPYTFDACCDGISLCIPEDLVPSADRANFDEESCSEARMLCIPKEMAADPDGYAPENCESWDGAEGRCLPECLPEVADKAAYLTQDRCTDGYICDPCFDPITGEDTGACTISGDPGPDDAAYTFPECCDGKSVCVPVDAIAESDRDFLSRDSCESEETLCVPKPLASAPDSYVADHCTIWEGAEGRCLPACLPEVAQNADWLPQADCPEGHLCAPCTDPLTGEDTQACSIGGDPGPKDDRYTFSECCGGLSLCIPEASVPEADRPNFESDGCSFEGALCVPKDMASDPANYRATECESWGGAEGRCLPACLPDVAEAADRLNRDICADGYLCVPCTDQITEETTGACTIAADPGPSKPPVKFESCCGGISVCVPEAAVPVGERSNFDRVGCEATELCVPRDIATDTYVPNHCLSWNNAEARCLPACLPKVDANAARIEQGDCPDDYLCAPCYDHVSREDTGSCSLGDDVGPQQDKSEYVFPECCGGNSVCTPLEAILDDQEDRFIKEYCSDDNELCVPKNIALDPLGYGVDQVHCESWGGGEGRCLSQCLREVIDAAASLKSDSAGYEDGCEPGSLCVPCYEPITGDITDACTQAGDAPTEPAYKFQRCCPQDANTRGTCIPSALVPENDQDSLLTDHAPEDVCDVEGQIDEDFLCVPDELAIDPDLALPSNCTVRIIFDFPGLCMADCFSTEDADALQGNCANSDDDCLPCLAGAPCE